MELLKEFYALFLHKCRNRIYHGWKIRESSSLCLLNPLIGVAVSIEHDLLMLSRIGLDQIMQGLLKSSACSSVSQASQSASATMVFRTIFGAAAESLDPAYGIQTYFR